MHISLNVHFSLRILYCVYTKNTHSNKFIRQYIDLNKSNLQICATKKFLYIKQFSSKDKIINVFQLLHI